MGENTSATDDMSPGRLLRFDAYDCLAYLVPGVVLAFGLYVYGEAFSVNQVSCLIPEMSRLSKALGEWPAFLTVATMGLVLIYIVGHIVALFSSALIDKLLMERTYGYPFEVLFGLELGPYIRRTRSLYKGVVFWLFVPILYVALWRIHYSWVTLFVFIPFFIAALSKILMTILLLRDVCSHFSLREPNHPARRFGDMIWNKGLKWIARYLCNYPFDFFSKSILSLFRMKKPFSPTIRKEFIRHFNMTFHVDPLDLDTDVYWLTYAYVCRNDPASRKLLAHWLNLYAFARNLAMAFFILFAYGAICNNHVVEDKHQYCRIWTTVNGVCFLMFFLRYFYLYYNYYSKFLFRSFMASALCASGLQSTAAAPRCENQDHGPLASGLDDGSAREGAAMSAEAD